MKLCLSNLLNGFQWVIHHFGPSLESDGLRFWVSDQERNEVRFDKEKGRHRL